MKLSDFDYKLPKELIAQEGTARRDASRLLVLHPDGKLEHRKFADIAQFLRKGDLVIVNDTRVLKARLYGKKETGGKTDCLLLSSKINGENEVYLRGKPFKPGARVFFESDAQRLTLTVTERIQGAKYRVKFDKPDLIPAIAKLPIPPYIKKTLAEEERYQTVYSKTEGALAAPTAGLHFTPELMQALERQGVEFAAVTLHIGIGTFAPILAEDFEGWKMHEEYFEISPETATKIKRARSEGRRILAVGTTVVRSLESALRDSNEIKKQSGSTDIFIYPGYNFQFPYAGLLTNFHLPKSSLLLLASAFAGKEKILDAYREAIREKYRFYSLGDAMLILKS